MLQNMKNLCALCDPLGDRFPAPLRLVRDSYADNVRFYNYLDHMNTPTPKRLADIRNDFERGVFLTLYNSRRQRLHRVIARVVLGFKHGLRGILFSWPLYLLPLAAWQSQARYLPIVLLLLLPGFYISGMILWRGVRDDYARLVDGTLLRSGYPGRLLFPGSISP